MPVVKKETGGAKVEAGTHCVVCIETHDKVFEEDRFGNPEKIILRCQFPDLEDEDSDSVTLDAMCNYKLSPLSKFWSWCEAFGINPDDYEEVDTDELVGKEALAKVIIQKKDDGSEWSRIDGFTAMPKQKNAPRPSQRPTEASGPVVIADDPQERLNQWWVKTRAAGLGRKEVIEQSTFAYDGREPVDLTDEERESVFQMLSEK